MAVRVLFLSDTHLGFDLPLRPRVRRRRRGHDFMANYLRALEPALAGDVDLVVHGGDLFHRARVPPSLVYQAFEPLERVAAGGVPVFVVPGNHERSRIPHARFAYRPGIHIWEEPKTFRLRVAGWRVALAGFPYARRVRAGFPSLVAATGWRPSQADVSLLCVHHCFEGATVGPSDYTFRSASDVVRGRDVPEGFAAVLTGHVHRHQVLTRDLAGRRLAAPVFYPGSVERTAFAEMHDPKGCLLLEFRGADPARGGALAAWRFVPLPARPMVLRERRVSRHTPPAELRAWVQGAVREAPADAVLRLKVSGPVPASVRVALSAPRLRAMAPPQMNVEIVLTE
jgi:DNA repair exonuclease SbcCD nuclease subunit